MSNYTKTTNFLAKDSLPSSDTAKIIRGSEFDTEFNNLVTAIASKANKLNAALTGTPTAPTATAGTNTTQVATTAFVNTKVGTLGTMATQNSNAVSISGGAVVGITDLLPADGGTGVSTLPSKNVLIGEGTSAVTGVAPGTSGNVLQSNGSAWTSAASATGITTTTGSLPYYGARGFGWFNASSLSVGTGSKNFGSVAKIAAGIFRVTLSTAMPDTNYVVVAMGDDTTNAASRGNMITSVGAQATGTFDIHLEERLGALSTDDVRVNWIIYQ
jgi:hypothetical protein